MTGDEIRASAQGTLLSILFARANSMAYALPGAIRSDEAGWDGLPGCVVEPGLPSTGSNDGESNGEENESRYRAMKKTSLRAQTQKSQF